MNGNRRYFHFTLGPVQGFVAQARRTRDFWGGSFLLSWLSGCAMRAVRGQDGIILFPKADENYLDWLDGKGSGQTPRQGSIPNRFKAEVDAGFDPLAVEQAVQSAWSRLADAVWRMDLAHLDDSSTETIWKRQVSGFWEINWAVTDDIEDSALLDRLKNWRSHFPPPEPGVKCMVMEGLQELSGAPAPGQEVADFWRQLRNGGGKGMATDLRQGEHLCAIAFIKRRFVRCFHSLENGWPVEPGVPSVAYMAAAPWLAKIAVNEHCANERQAFIDAARALQKDMPETSTRIRCLEEIRNDSNKALLNMDGSLFFDALLDNSGAWDPDQRRQAAAVLQALKRWRSKADMEPVSPFYAILLMDGDNLGIHMSSREKQSVISSALKDFTGAVEATVNAHNGFLIYAGGDDVLAMLPLEDALPCARALRERYLQAFAGSDIPTTLSGAIEYAHIKIPLGKVLADAHPLLDDIAKESCGRDAIACRVWKPGGLALEWALPWERALGGNQVIVQQLADAFRNREQDEEGFSSRFFYRIRERFEFLNGNEDNREPVLDEDQQVRLMTMEYLNSGKSDAASDISEARQRVAQLLEQCRPAFRDASGNIVNDNAGIRADGALLLRFLAHKGLER